MSGTFEKVLILKNVSLFETVSESALSDLIMAAEEKTYKSGEEIISRSLENHYLFIVLNGLIQCVDDKGSVTEFGPRQFFGEATVLCPAVIPYDLKAVEQTTLLRISGNKLYQVMALHPSLAKGFIGELSRRLRRRRDESI